MSHGEFEGGQVSVSTVSSQFWKALEGNMPVSHADSNMSGSAGKHIYIHVLTHSHDYQVSPLTSQSCLWGATWALLETAKCPGWVSKESDWQETEAQRKDRVNWDNEGDEETETGRETRGRRLPEIWAVGKWERMKARRGIPTCPSLLELVINTGQRFVQQMVYLNASTACALKATSLPA